MLNPGPAKKVTIHLNEDTSSRSDFLSREILDLLLREGVAGATLVRPETGFGSHHRLHDDSGVHSPGHMPLRIEFTEEQRNLDRFLPALIELVTDGLVEAHETVVLKAAAGTAQ